MKTINNRFFLTALIAVLTISLSYAQPCRNNSGRQFQANNNFKSTPAGIENRIPDLTEDQKADLKALRLEHMKVMREYRNQMGELAAKQRTIMSADEVDLKAAEKIVDQKTALMNKQMKARVKHQAAVKKVLTEEQILFLDQQRPNRKAGNHFGRMAQHRNNQGQCAYGRPGPAF